MIRIVIVLIGLAILSSPSNAQRIPDPNQGNTRLTQWGVLDGNRVRTLFANHGEIARWPDQPSGEWPKGSGHSYIDGIAFIVSVRTLDAEGRVIKPMSTNYREFIDRDPVSKEPWGWAPVPGYSNPRQESPARSDDPATWPSDWPDRPINWAGQWNGFFGRGVQNADVESYFIFDDSPDREWTQEPNRFFPCSGDTSRGGLGLEVSTRAFQWSHPLAQDVIFWLYEITNECDVDYEDVYFSQYIDWGTGGTDDSGDDEGAYNTKLDLAFAWDFDGIGTPGMWGPVGTAGYAFLESPGNHTDIVDNDEDGITNERRNSGPGQLIVGQDAIRAYVASNYNVVNFESFYRGLEERPAFLDGRWWTGDEEMDWLGFQDLNESGEWDAEEPLRDDVGEDGLSPTSPNYPGRDMGEGDGVPTAGEPNFDALDKDESDQIGLTGFSIFNVHDYELIDDAETFNVLSRALPPLEDIVLEGGRNLGMFFSSGPFPLAAGQTERFSMALIFADKDFTDPTEIENSSLARKKETVQQIYNADYRFARPPNKPQLTAAAGDGQVTLLWDDLAEKSFDPFLREFDFEGYLVFRSTEPNFEENLTITDAFGNRIFQKPIAQFDLNNGLRGPHPVAVNGVQFNIGTDSGLRHSFIDRDVVNGQTYYYAIVAYDRGFLSRNPDGTVATNPDGSTRGLSPSLTTAIIKNDVAGNIVEDVNTAVMTPRAPAAGYIPPELEMLELSTIGTGSVAIDIASPASIQQQASYELAFTNPSVWQNAANVEYRLTNITTGSIVEEGIVTNGRREIPPLEGFLIDIRSDTDVAVIDTTVRYVGEAGTFLPAVRAASTSPAVASRYVPLPADFEIHFTDAVADTSLRLAFGMLEIPVPFFIENLTTGRRQPFVILEDINELRDGSYDHGELIVIVSGETPDSEPLFAGGAWRSNWTIRLIPPDPQLEPDTPIIPPAPGTSLRFRTSKPFQTGDIVTFALQPASFSKEKAIIDMDEIFVVPNPYVATSTFEPSNAFRAGRGERRLFFMNLPSEATVRIYTITGQLVQTLYHNSTRDDGQLAWDLVTKDGMNIAYGIYLYHVEAPGIGERVGRFAVIK
ncbi:MAG: hypothetical protein BMS9Abin05_1329 [Rhodothermia bacterium]|nr:MAG: hypothetical protein BMS9Abin05_1329 [Rhodothermia bacterium]